jgi:hypothetical protein
MRVLGEVDANWLLSTTAQSAAALVAIVGGLLVSRLVALATERQGLVRRLDEIDATRSIRRDVLQDVYEERHEFSVRVFERSTMDRFVEAEGQLESSEMADIVEGNWPRGAQQQEVARMAVDLAERVRRAYDVVNAHNGETHPPRLRSMGIHVPDEDERIYYAIKKRFSEGPLPVGPLSNNPIADQRQDRRIEREGELSAEVRALDAEADVVKSQLRSLSKPRGLTRAVAVLTYFAIVGIVVPLGAMTRRPVPNGPVFRIVIVVLFVSGLGALLAFVLALVRELRWEEPEAPPPIGTPAAAAAPTAAGRA